MMRSFAYSRRVLALGTSSVLLLSGVGLALAAGEGGGLGLPTAGCNTYTDAAGDAPFAGSTAEANGAPDPIPSDAALDITGVVMGTTSSSVAGFIRVKGLGNRFYGEGDLWTLNFTALGKTVSGVVQRGPADPLVDAVLAPLNYVLIAGTEDDTVGITAVWDYAHSVVIITLDRASLEKALKGSLGGAPLTAMSARSGNRYAVTSVGSDAAVAPAAQAFTVGSNPCFGAGPGPTATEPGGGTPAPTTTPSGTGTPSPQPTTEPPAGGPPPLFAFPRTGCLLYKDAAGDAFPGRSGVKSPNSSADLDFTGVAVRSAPDAVSVFAKIATLGTSPGAPFTGHKFTTSFVINGKTVTAVASAAGAATMTPATAKATAAFDTAKSYVIFTFPKADLETAAGAPITSGTAITDLKWVSNAVNQAGDFDGDSAAGTTAEEKTYAYGDNTCFQPPAALIELDTTGKGVYTDKSVVDVLVSDADENALPEVKVHLALTGMPELVGVTDEDGIASFSFPITVPAGSKTLTATFLGNADAGPAGAGAPFTVAAESTVLKAVAGKGTVTATLKDNDKTAVAGQLVAFKVGSKITKIKTNAKGVAVLSRLAKGTSVTVSYAGLKGKYLAAKAVTTKVL